MPVLREPNNIKACPRSETSKVSNREYHDAHHHATRRLSLTPVSVPTNGLIRVSALVRKKSSAASAKRPSREISDKPPALGSRSVGSLPDDGGGGARQPQRLSQSVAKARSI